VLDEQYLGGTFSSDIVKKMREDPTAIGKLFKYYFSLTKKEQRERFEARTKDPLKQ
jgi:polyphosphate kinase 2 (PPK2 family)